jgi:hypothetical protein
MSIIMRCRVNVWKDTLLSVSFRRFPSHQSSCLWGRQRAIPRLQFPFRQTHQDCSIDCFSLSRSRVASVSTLRRWRLSQKPKRGSSRQNRGKPTNHAVDPLTKSKSMPPPTNSLRRRAVGSCLDVSRPTRFCDREHVPTCEGWSSWNRRYGATTFPRRFVHRERNRLDSVRLPPCGPLVSRIVCLTPYSLLYLSTKGRLSIEWS